MNWDIRTSTQPEVLWQCISTGRSNAAKIECVDFIEFVESTDQMPNIHYQTVLVDLAHWDHYWKQDPCNFVPVDLHFFPKHCCKNEMEYQAELATHRQKIERWQSEVPKTARVPAVCFEDAMPENRLKIKQGRHRIAYLRQIGLPVFAAAVPVHLIPIFKSEQLMTKCLITDI